jgi:protein-tyrosine-phosphatase
VLFVCTGNSSRSPIAEALLRQHVGDGAHVVSAGTRPRAELHPHAVRVLAEEYGVDVSAQRPRPLDLDTRHYDRVVTLCDRAREALPATGRATRSHWSVADPAAPGPRGRPGYRSFVAAAADIATRVRHLVPTLVTAS